MKNYSLKLNEVQMEMLGTALENFDIREFLYDNPKIEDEGSVSYYEDELYKMELVVSIHNDGLEADYDLEENVETFNKN